MEEFCELVNVLKKNHLSVTAAESCTAGLFTSMIASVPGASEVLGYGFVVYSPEAKQQILGVQKQTIDMFGVVSENTAIEMARGAAKNAKADVSVGITGFAGPGADDGFAPGTVCFGFLCKDICFAETILFGDIGRNIVREKSAAYAAKRLLLLLEECGCN